MDDQMPDPVGDRMDDFPTSLVPLEGGFSGETFLAQGSAEQVVVRIYGGRSLARGPAAPEVDAAVLELVRGLLPVPRVLEVRAGAPEADRPGLLVVSRLPGKRLDLVLPGLAHPQLAELGTSLGVLLGRLGHMTQPRAGFFSTRELALDALPQHLRDLPTWVHSHEEQLRLDPSDLDSLSAVAAAAQDVLDAGESRTCLVHGDLNPKNVLVDPATLEVTGLVDWEFCHAGSPYADLGNLLRFDRSPALSEAVLESYRCFLPNAPEDLLDLARASDLFALVDLAAREVDDEVTRQARQQLLEVARTGDLHAVAAPPVA